MRMDRYALVILLFATALGAQRADLRESYGGVTGHVVCADTNQPARLATITLQPLADDARTPANATIPGATGLLQFQTRLDGSFVIPRVRPGRYYVVVQKTGYLSPVAEFSKDEIDHPTEDVRKEIDRLTPLVVVAGNETAHVEMRLYRAAAVSGVLRYDDGTPVSTMFVQVYFKDHAGKWERAAGLSGGLSDDRGRYRITDLPAREYRLKIQLEVSEHVVSAVFGSSRSSTGRTKYSLDFYLGDTFLAGQARLLKLGEGEDSAGGDFTVSLARLHSLQGSLVDARSGRAINAGTVQLLQAEDRKYLVSATVDEQDATFRFDFVPEGKYIVVVDNARSVTREEQPAPRDGFAVHLSEFKEVTVRSYGKYEAPFTVDTDLTGVTLAVPGKE